ncbi:metallophosphoesterase [Candidatus Woesearchaeota archaeon]|nr:metallophosphoesterase [Candidatus Woesearchaeota archaeon]
MRDLYILSDLHLSDNGANEDFNADETFAAFLHRIHKESKDATLVLNGDIVDFLQVSGVAERFKPDAGENTYGMGTEPAKSAWKLGKVVEGHPVFFKALGEFAEQHDVVLISGNHDAEWHWPEVKAALLETLRAHGAKKQNITLSPWFYHEAGRVWIEHGHQYDALNSFRHFLAPVLPDNHEQLVLPWGSFFVRYFFNKVERYDEYADNFRPCASYIPYMLRYQTLQGLRLLRYYLPFFWKTWAKALRSYSAAEWAVVEKLHHSKRDSLAGAGLSQKTLELVDAERQQPLLEKHMVFWHMLASNWRDAYPEEAIAKRLRLLTGTKQVIFGHTHDAKSKQGYLNTGSWTPRATPVGRNLVVKTQYPYVRVHGLQARLKFFKSTQF